MKKLFLLLISFGLVVVISAQQPKSEKIPSATKTGFAASFPTVQKVKWSVEKPGEYEAEFRLNGNEASALFDDKGNLLETETEIGSQALPQAVKTRIARDFAGYKLNEIEKSTDPKGVVSFEMEAVKGKEKLELSFDITGKLLGKEPLKAEKK